MRQLQAYIDRRNERIDRQNDAIESARGDAPGARFVPWRTEYDRARSAGEVIRVRGLN